MNDRTHEPNSMAAAGWPAVWLAVVVFAGVIQSASPFRMASRSALPSRLGAPGCGDRVAFCPSAGTFVRKSACSSAAAGALPPRRWRSRIERKSSSLRRMTLLGLNMRGSGVVANFLDDLLLQRAVQVLRPSPPRPPSRHAQLGPSSPPSLPHDARRPSFSVFMNSVARFSSPCFLFFVLLVRSLPC